MKKSGGSSAGRAPSLGNSDASKSGQTEQVSDKQNGEEPASESAHVPSPISEGKAASTEAADAPGKRGETSGVVGSNPTHRTNFIATETPPHIAKDMVLLAGIQAGMWVLEPSAGTGNLVRAIHRFTSCKVVAVELNKQLAETLRETNAYVLRRDFLTYEPDSKMDRVVMNPPINAIDHVLHAYRMLKRGGRLVALVHRSVAMHFRKEHGAQTYHLPDNTFVRPNVTGREGFIACSIIVMDRP